VRRLLAPRFAAELLDDEDQVRETLGLPPNPEAVSPRPIATEWERPAERGYRLKVSLQWMPRVWRVIEMLEDQTLDDLHYAIQHAFGWDDDHLYAFFLSGRAWDTLTEVASPRGAEEDAEGPLTDDVTLAALELAPKQRFLYLFDFGDELRHAVEVLDGFPAPAGGDFPRIVQEHGKAPPQYPSRDEGDDELADEDDDGPSNVTKD
jgi:hypothetical protein